MKRALALTAIVIGTAIAAYTVLDDPHAFSQEECGTCHVDSENMPTLLVGTVTSLCMWCHEDIQEAASHPVDIAPRLTTVPPDLPLTDGALTCNTCHNVHADRYTVFRVKSYYLRRAGGGQNFCISCHSEDPVEMSHTQMFQSAHLGSKFIVTDPSNPLDQVSAECIGCHDGAIGASADYEIGTGYWTHLAGAHPIGVDYTESRMKGKKLRPLSMLDESLKFYDGKVGCATCHDPYSTAPKQLVKLNHESGLCVECHIGY